MNNTRDSLTQRNLGAPAAANTKKQVQKQESQPKKASNDSKKESRNEDSDSTKGNKKEGRDGVKDA